MPTAWVAQKLDTKQRPDGGTENVVAESTTVYANDQIEATKVAQAILGTPHVTVTAIPSGYGGVVPSDQDIARTWREMVLEGQPDETAIDGMRGAGGGAYQ